MAVKVEQKFSAWDRCHLCGVQGTAVQIAAWELEDIGLCRDCSEDLKAAL